MVCVCVSVIKESVNNQLLKEKFSSFLFFSGVAAGVKRPDLSGLIRWGDYFRMSSFNGSLSSGMSSDSTVIKAG